MYYSSNKFEPHIVKFYQKFSSGPFKTKFFNVINSISKQLRCDLSSKLLIAISYSNN